MDTGKNELITSNDLIGNEKYDPGRVAGHMSNGLMKGLGLTTMNLHARKAIHMAKVGYGSETQEVSERPGNPCVLRGTSLAI